MFILSSDVGTDSLYDDQFYFLNIIADITGIEKDHIMMAGTHNHNCFGFSSIKSGWATGDGIKEKAERYQELLEKAYREVAEKAIANMRPAKLGFGRSKCYANVNRHCYSETGNPSIAGFEPDRPSDRELIVLNVLNEDDKPLALIYNYAAHASLLANNKPDGEYTELSGDWPGVVSTKLEEHYGNNMVALHLTGAGGDQNMVMISRVYDVLPDGKGIMHDFGPTAYIILDFISDMVVRSTIQAVNSITKYKEHTRIWSSKRTVAINDDYYLFADGKFMTPHNCSEFQFNLIMLGNIALAGMGGEVYTAIGMRFKDDSPYRDTMFITHAGNYAGYLKDDSGHGLAENCIRENLYDMMEEYADK